MKQHMILQSIKQFLNKHLVVVVISGFGLGFLTNWVMFGSSASSDQRQSVGTSGKHQHEEKKEDTDKQDSMPQIPLPFQIALSRLKAAYQDVTLAVKSRDSEKIRNTIVAMKAVLQSGLKDAEHLRGNNFCAAGIARRQDHPQFVDVRLLVD